MTTTSAARPVFQLLLSMAGLVIWAGHFTAIYAVSAVACERGWITRALAGLPMIPTVVGLATLVALALLCLIMRPAVAGLAAPMTEGGEVEPRFTRWLTVSTALLAMLAVVFQAVPPLLLLGCD